MNLVKTLLLGSAAALAGSLGAQAADLPVRKAAPVDYVRVCDFTGSGYFYIPGTDTCIQIGGLVRTEGAFINNARQFYPTATVGASTRLVAGGTTIIGRDADTSGFFSQGRLNIDTRTQTAYGTLRAYIRYNIYRYQGLYQGGGVAGGQTSFANQGGNLAVLTKGFIQFAGITAGRIQSFFDFYADNYNYEGIANSDLNTNVFAYTYRVGGGLTASLSLESHEVRTDGIGTIQGGVNEVGGINQGATALTARYGGSMIPDVVGQVNYTQAWGQAQLSAAYHQVNTNAGPFAGTGGQGYQHRDADGFAVQGGVQFKLPMLAAGDDLWVEGAYQNGAYLYQDSVGYANAGFQSRYLGGFQHIDHDAIAIGNGAGGTYGLALSRGFSVMAAINHYFTSTFHDVLFGSYEQSGYGRAKNIDWTLGGLGDMTEYRIGKPVPVRSREEPRVRPRIRLRPHRPDPRPQSRPDRHRPAARHLQEPGRLRVPPPRRARLLRPLAPSRRSAPPSRRGAFAFAGADAPPAEPRRLPRGAAAPRHIRDLSGVGRVQRRDTDPAARVAGVGRRQPDIRQEDPMTTIASLGASPDPAPSQPNPTEVPSNEPVGIPQPGPDVIDPGIGIPTGPSPTPTSPGTPGAPTSPGVA